MKEMFLCSDRLDKYQSMGENGQAVHLSALQLRETLRLRRYADVADTLAIPQINEHGDRIDWYAPFAGDVVPWSAATENERQAALSQLEMNQHALRKFSDELRQHDKPEQRLFGQLLEKALQFPDNQHVWLVGGKPVISFWGFVNARHQARLDPLDCLRPAVSAAPSAVAQPAVEPVTTPVAPQPLRRGWWWRIPGWLRWLLPLLLLLLLVLFFLRSCVPGVHIPGISPSLPTPPNAHITPDPAHQTDNVTLLPAGESGVALSGEPVAHAPVTAVDGAPADADAGAALPTVDGSTGGQGEGAFPATTDDAATEPATAPEAAPVDPAMAPAVDPATPGDAPSASGKTPLMLPPEALAQGNTTFLNGRWHAGAGIQDQRTGKPLSLNYQIKDGKGEVQMTRGDGVSCRGEVNAAIQAGQLVLNNAGEAQCSDGSAYRMPEVLCAPGAKSIADCKGRYDASTLFPISMKQEAGN